MKWDSEALWRKAVLYIDRANQYKHKSTEFPFWSALALELLARAALTKTHPALNADPRDDLNLLYAFGFIRTEQPKSLAIHAVFLRLEKTVLGFGKVQRELCDYLTFLRNEELHSADLPFETLKESKWLPRYYETCQVLCGYLEKELDDLLGTEVAESARKLIGTLDKNLESIVKTKIAAHTNVFQAKSAGAQKAALEAAQRITLNNPWGPNATTHNCPACGAPGLLRGELIKEFKPIYEYESLLIDREFLAVQFSCPACDLDLKNHEEIAHSPIEPRFTRRRHTDLHELLEPEEPDPYMNM